MGSLKIDHSIFGTCYGFTTLVATSAREALFGIPSDTASLERNYLLADDDLDLIGTRRSAENRLGLAIHIALLRYPGQG